MNSRLVEKCSHTHQSSVICSLCSCVFGSQLSLTPCKKDDPPEVRAAHAQALFAEALRRGADVDQVWFSRTNDGLSYKWIAYDLPTMKMLLLATPGFYQAKYDPIRLTFFEHFVKMSKDPETVKLFLLSGNDLPRVFYGQLMQFVYSCDRASKIQRWIAQYNMRLVKPLLHLARLAARRHLKSNTVHGVAVLTCVPVAMKKYLNFSDAQQEVPYTTVPTADIMAETGVVGTT